MPSKAGGPSACLGTLFVLFCATVTACVVYVGLVIAVLSGYL